MRAQHRSRLANVLLAALRASIFPPAAIVYLLRCAPKFPRSHALRLATLCDSCSGRGGSGQGPAGDLGEPGPRAQQRADAGRRPLPGHLHPAARRHLRHRRHLQRRTSPRMPHPSGDSAQTGREARGDAVHLRGDEDCFISGRRVREHRPRLRIPLTPHHEPLFSARDHGPLAPHRVARQPTRRRSCREPRAHQDSRDTAEPTTCSGLHPHQTHRDLRS
uniref:G_PROTEIN_RECEP_F1_2 domain-containing protein n=1 Tax=Steinernema glaseri TaxID=37863 RepID=A0A1I7Y4S1_9BILA